MLWLAFDPQRNAEVMLNLPRLLPTDAQALERWQQAVAVGARLAHPNLAPVVEVGVQEHWPFVVVERGTGITVTEWLATHPNPQPADAVGWVVELLQGLAFAHEAGAAHLDLQLQDLLIDERGCASLMGIGVALGPGAAVEAISNERAMALAPGLLRARRAAAARDVLTCGVLLHQLLAGQPAIDQPDAALVIERMAPLGRELVRLPWSTPLPIPEALRAIVNRCTSGQERLRYQSARSLLGALNGWLEAQAEAGGGPIALLMDRLSSVGHLPALPGLAARVARVTSLESQHTDEIADQVLDDMALSFELLRTLHTAQVQGTQVQGNGPVLTLRRVISLIGVNGVRLAANTLRAWPGPLTEPQAVALQATLDRVRLAGHLAQALRPRGYDAQVVYLITTLQNLGRLMLRYHFADEAAQIDHLTKPSAAQRDAGVPEQPGLSEAAAAFAVLGVDVDSLGAAVARQWGLGDDVMHMARRLPADAPVRKPDADADVLRLTASAANDVIDAVHLLTGPPLHAAFTQISQRYARVLAVGPRDIAEALQSAHAAMRRGTPMEQKGGVTDLTPALVATVGAAPFPT
jgi:eukaryotic-like serine/threonine-protein kinase